MSNCRQCGLDHKRLGIEINGRTLHRSADKSRHILHAGGGGWAFEGALLSHHPEIDYLIVTDRISRETWRASRETFDRYAFDFGAGGRAQKALALRHWDDGHERQPEPVPDETGVQLIMDMGTASNRTIFEKAKKPRPRAEPKRRRWS